MLKDKYDQGHATAVESLIMYAQDKTRNMAVHEKWKSVNESAFIAYVKAWQSGIRTTFAANLEVDFEGITVDVVNTPPQKWPESLCQCAKFWIDRGFKLEEMTSIKQAMKLKKEELQGQTGLSITTALALLFSLSRRKTDVKEFGDAVAEIEAGKCLDIGLLMRIGMDAASNILKIRSAQEAMSNSKKFREFSDRLRKINRADAQALARIARMIANALTKLVAALMGRRAPAM